MEEEAKQSMIDAHAGTYHSHVHLWPVILVRLQSVSFRASKLAVVVYIELIMQFYQIVVTVFAAIYSHNIR